MTYRLETIALTLKRVDRDKKLRKPKMNPGSTFRTCGDGANVEWEGR